MIKNIILSSIFFCFIIALMLAFAGLQRVELGSDFLTFLKACSNELDEYKIEIPDIPFVQTTNNTDWWSVFLDGIINFINFLVNILNVVIKILNVAISLIQFIIVIVKNVLTLVDNIQLHNSNNLALV